MILAEIRQVVIKSLNDLFDKKFAEDDFQVNQTKPEFEGDYTIVLFSLVKSLKKSPESLGNELGKHILSIPGSIFTGYNVIKGFLNLTISDRYWVDMLERNYRNPDFGRKAKSRLKVMVEYSSPNTNKPLHLGHLRNNFLGWSVAEILKANGELTIKTCIVNDRGIHICKSMIAWKLFAKGATPESTGKKGDHFVGDYYVKFNEEFKKEVETLEASGKSKVEAEKEAPIMKAAQQMLVDWEAGKPEVIGLWKMMNSWVYEGFDETYKKIGSDFDQMYYESDTYLLGKELVEYGLEKGVFV